MYFPLCVRSTYSLLLGLSKGWQIAKRVQQCGLGGAVLTDYSSLSGVPSFGKAMLDACKHCGHPSNQHADGGKGKCSAAGVVCPGFEPASLKSIYGNDFGVVAKDAAIKDETNQERAGLTVIAKNLEGWRHLVTATSLSNSEAYFYRKPRIDLEKLASIGRGSWVVYSGRPGSTIANACFADHHAAYAAQTYESAKSFAKPWNELKDEIVAIAKQHQELFGKDNFFLGVELIDAINMPAAAIVAKILRWVSKETGIPCVAVPNSHYPSPEDSVDHMVLLCSLLDATLSNIETKASTRNQELFKFVRSKRYHIPSHEEMVVLHEPAELANTIAVSEMCEQYNIFRQPMLPKFTCPDGVSSDEHLRQLCREGWKKKVFPILKDKPELKEVYGDRVKKELKVLNEAGLTDYFLIVDDYCRHAREVLKCKSSPGRGSAAGSLVLHLLGVTNCDPIKYDLLFERFYNAGRNTPGRVSMPDVDCDFPAQKRDLVFDYIREKYGQANTAQMATFGRIQGRKALDLVMRANNKGTFDERKEVTKHIPDEGKIIDQLQEMREETGEASILRWTLENTPEPLKDYCRLNDDGTLDGPLASYFAQAMRLEGTKQTQSKHAAGIVISPRPLADDFPMIYDKSTGRAVVGYEMADVEACGGVKMDVLSLSCLDKIQGAIHTIRTGEVP